MVRKPANAATEKSTQPIAVDSAAVSRADVPIYLQGLGTVQAFYTVTVTARVDGELEKIGFTEGQTVHKGDLLAQIDPRPNRAALDQATRPRPKTRHNSRMPSGISSATPCCSLRIWPASKPSTRNAQWSTS
jgi:hypothetical protein